MRLQDALQIPLGLTAIIGGGGKSTLLLCLGRELAPTPANLTKMKDIVQDLVVSAILSDEAEKEAGEGKNQPATQS